MVSIDVLIALLSLIHITWIISKSKKNLFFYLLLICHILVIIWICGHIIVVLASDIYIQLSGTLLFYLGVDFITPFWFLFALNIVEYKHCRNKKLTTALFLPSVLIWLFMLTDRFHHLFFVTYEYRYIVHSEIANAFSVSQCLLFYFSIYLLIKSPNVKLSRFDTITMSALIILTTIILFAFTFIPALSAYNETSSSGYDVSLPILAVAIIVIIFIVNKYKFLPIQSVALQTVVNNINSIIIVCDSNNGIDFVNKSFYSVFDYDYTKKNQLNDFLSYVCQYASLKDQAVIRRLGLSEDHLDIQNIKLSFQKEITFTVQVRQLKNQKGKFIGKVILFQDTTVSQALAIEKERIRIAQDFHDTLGHTLTVIVTLMRLAKIELSKNNCQTAESKVNEALSLSVEGISEIRNIVNNLKNNRFNLISQSIYYLIEKTNKLTIKIDLLVQGEENLMHQKHHDVIYLLCKEAITNALKHSGARKMDIVIKFSESMIKIFIIDNGKGCKDLRKGNGFSNIEEKVINSGGHISYSASQSIGFSITVEIPVRSD